LVLWCVGTFGKLTAVSAVRLLVCVSSVSWVWVRLHVTRRARAGWARMCASCVCLSVCLCVSVCVFVERVHLWRRETTRRRSTWHVLCVIVCTCLPRAALQCAVFWGCVCGCCVCVCVCVCRVECAAVHGVAGGCGIVKLCTESSRVQVSQNHGCLWAHGPAGVQQVARGVSALLEGAVYSTMVHTACFADAVVRQVDGASGLSSAEAEARLRTVGTNGV
jgi:hypothetical protein